MAAVEEFPSDVGSMTDDNISLSESLTEELATVADAPRKIPLAADSIRSRLYQVTELKMIMLLF